MFTPSTRLALSHWLEKLSGALTSVCFPAGCRLSAELELVVRREGDRLAADIVAPVPLHRQGSRARGFNQVDIFGRLRLPYRPVLLVRSRRRPEKHLLRSDERWAAVSGAFAIRESRRVDNLRILLLDDVMTTGATLDACSRVLRKACAYHCPGWPAVQLLSRTPVS